MKSETTASSRLLPVSIIGGPFARKALRDLAARNPKATFGVLADPCVRTDEEFADKNIVIRALAGPNTTDRDLGSVREDIVGFATEKEVSHLFIECDSKTHPIAFAALFIPGNSESYLSRTGQLHSIIMATGSKELVDSIVHGNEVIGVFSPCILADQIECADLIILDGDSDKDCAGLARSIATTLNPRARVEGIDSWSLSATQAFDFEATFTGAGWRTLMEMDERIQRGDHGIVSFLYRARRPFHPERFWSLLQRPFAGVFRAKGFFWLATRMGVVGGLNIAGSERHFSPAGEWWATHLEHDHSEETEVPERLKKEWVEPYGDRRQAIAFMGIGIDPDKMIGQLDSCLLSESEMAAGVEEWEGLADPFPDWTPHAHDHECGECDCEH